jgi:hypothetical protein
MAEPLLFGQCPACALRAAFEPPRTLETLLGFEDYELLGQIGRGGMGVVYRARQLSLNRIVALKMLLHADAASPASLERFRFEAESSAHLHHPNIVRIYEVGEHAGQPFFTMDLIEGERLSDAIARKEFLPTPNAARNKAAVRSVQQRAARLMATVAWAVHHAHLNGVVHRDLKPSNILLDQQGVPHVTDFGLARRLQGNDELTSSGSILGTPSYMAPEQAAGRAAGPAADVYSLGAIFYELLTGKPPFSGKTVLEVLRQVERDQPPDPSIAQPVVDRDLTTICLKCLEKDSRRRYATAALLAEDLERWAKGDPIHARPIGRVERCTRWVKRYPAAAALIVTLFTALIASLWFLQVVNAERDARRLANNIFLKSLEKSAAAFSERSDVIEFTSEELGALERRTAAGSAGSRRSVGVVVENAWKAALSYSGMLRDVESAMSRELHSPIRISLRLYRTAEVAEADLAAGRVDFLRIPAPDYASEKNRGSGLIPLFVEVGDRQTTIVMVRPESGITNVAGLRGHRVLFWLFTDHLRVAVQARLFEEGLCESDMEAICRWKDAPAAQEFKNNLDAHRVDAVISGQWQSEKILKHWIQIAAYDAPSFIWVARGGVPTNELQVFRDRMRVLRPSYSVPSQRWERAVDVTASDFERLIRAVADANAFSECRHDLPPPSSAP